MELKPRKGIQKEKNSHTKLNSADFRHRQTLNIFSISNSFMKSGDTCCKNYYLILLYFQAILNCTFRKEANWFFSTAFSF